MWSSGSALTAATTLIVVVPSSLTVPPLTVVAVASSRGLLEPRSDGRFVVDCAVLIVGDGRTQGAGGARRVAGDVVVGLGADRGDNADRGGAVLVDGAAVDGGRRS